MTTPTTKFIDEITRDQFDAFERQERQLRMEQRKERAAQLKLPVLLHGPSHLAPSERPSAG